MQEFAWRGGAYGGTPALHYTVWGVVEISANSSIKASSPPKLEFEPWQLYRCID